MSAAAGTSVPRSDARAKVTGQAMYAVDMSMAGQAIGAVVRSQRGHARISEIDASAALEVPGVVAVITAGDLGGLFPRFGHIVADHPILADGRVRYYGEPVALVVAESSHAAGDAAELVDVTYQDLPSVLDAEAALEPGAPLLHDRSYDLGDSSFGEAFDEEPSQTSNIAHEAVLEWGDVDAAFQSADEVVQTTMRYPMLYAYAMEPYNAVARFEAGHLEVITTAQHPFQVREDLARIFSLPLSMVRVTSPLLGGGYGSKSYTKLEPLAAVAAFVTGRPVKVAVDVEGAIYTTRADAAVISARSAFGSDGAILAREFDITLDSGAYADNSPLVLAKAVNRCFGPYRVPNLKVTGRSVYTNTPPASSYRGFGAPQGNLAGEANMDQAADRLGIDPGDLRRRNLLHPGETLLPGKRPLDADLIADLDMVLGALDPTRERPEGHGVGFGCSASDAGAFPVSTASVKVLADGSALVGSGSTEMGQGSRTALAQIASTELGIPMERVTVAQGDTALTPYERTTGASRTTTLAGVAVIRACAEVRRRLEEMAADAFGADIEEVKSADGVLAVPGRDDIPFGEVVSAWFGARAGEVTGVGVVRRADEQEMLPPFWEIGMVGVEMSIDPETGMPTIEHLVTVGDVGFAINPRLVEGQDLGAATQGLGAALFEELVFDGAQPLNANVVDYRVPRTTDQPVRIDTLIAERRDGIGPYGAKGAGEGALNPIGGAVAAAIARAVGRWPDRLPLTPERIWRLSREGKPE